MSKLLFLNFIASLSLLVPVLAQAGCRVCGPVGGPTSFCCEERRCQACDAGRLDAGSGFTPKGALPDEWSVCEAAGATTAGQILKFTGAGISEEEAGQIALWHCGRKAQPPTCRVQSCDTRIVRPRP